MMERMDFSRLTPGQEYELRIEFTSGEVLLLKGVLSKDMKIPRRPGFFKRLRRAWQVLWGK